jgi:hypothetical protein
MTHFVGNEALSKNISLALAPSIYFKSKKLVIKRLSMKKTRRNKSFFFPLTFLNQLKNAIANEMRLSKNV